MLQAEDRKMRQEKTWYEQANKGETWQPTPLQSKNMELWVEAIKMWPEEAKAMDGKPSRRTALADDMATVMHKTTEWMDRALAPTDIEKTILQFIQSSVQPPPLQPPPPPPPVQDSTNRIVQLNQLLEDGLITQQLHAALVAKALGL